MNLELQLGLAGIGQGAILAIFALGLVVIYSGSGVLNFGHGAIATFSAYLFLWLQNEHQWPKGLAFLAGALVAALIGFSFHALVLRPLRNAPPLAKVVPTLGLLVAITALIFILFGLNTPPRVGILPSGNIDLGFGDPHLTIGKDRLALAAIAVVATIVLAVVFRSTKYGLLTRALGDTEVALEISGRSPDRIASYNWAVGSLLGGLAGMLASTLAPLTPQFYTTLMVTAVAAALLAGFRSFVVTLLAAMLIGIAQPILTLHAPELRRWTTLSGWTESLPLVLIIAVFVFRGRGLPVRELTVTRPLPRVPVSAQLGRKVALGLIVSIVWIMVVPQSWVRGTTTSAIGVVLALSVVLIVGFLGQISLAQMTFAGAGAFTAAAASTEWGLPFPLPVMLGGLVAVPAGILFGIPALRVRGLNLAVVTLALTIAAQNLVFQDRRISGGDTGKATEPPSLFGLDLDPFQHPRRWAVVAVIFAAAACAVLGVLRRRFLGMSFLATRGNERGAAAAGLSLVQSKLIGFVIAAMFAGCAGSMMAYSSGQIGPASFAPLTSILLVAYAYLGGIGSISGAVIAGMALPFGVIATVIDVHNDWINLIAGAGIMMAVVLHPSGLAGIPQQIREHREAAAGRRELRTAPIDPVARPMDATPVSAKSAP